MTDKYCKDCEKFEWQGQQPVCTRLQHRLIDGVRVSGIALDADWERMTKCGCGMEAKYFEPKACVSRPVGPMRWADHVVAQEARDARDRWKAGDNLRAIKAEAICAALKEEIVMCKETVARARKDERRKCWETAKSFLPAPGSVTLLVNFERMCEKLSTIRLIANAIRPDGEKMI